jgi:hypothetical protein
MKYEVHLGYISGYTVTVDADNKTEAMAKAEHIARDGESENVKWFSRRHKLFDMVRELSGPVEP